MNYVASSVGLFHKKSILRPVASKQCRLFGDRHEFCTQTIYTVFFFLLQLLPRSPPGIPTSTK